MLEMYWDYIVSRLLEPRVINFFKTVQLKILFFVFWSLMDWFGDLAGQQEAGKR